MSDDDLRQLWDDRYGRHGYLFGTEPNDFLRETVTGVVIGVAPGPAEGTGAALCLADGEGRNGVFLAERGWQVTSVDLSETGMTKARALAEARNVDLDTVVADLAHWDLGRDRWDLVVSIFFHTPPPLRARIHAALGTALRPGGWFVLESYTPAQIGRGTGGPPVPELTMTLALLRHELTGLEIVHGAELDRSVIEGEGHTGDASVVQVIARRPG